jgi:hypothetical protein
MNSHESLQSAWGSTMSDDQSRIYNSLRASTIALLGYGDVDTLSAAQEIRISRAISLRLIVDAAQAKQLRGEPIDVKAFVEASENLETMCGGDPGAPAAGHDFSRAREELARLLDGRAEAIERNMAREPEKFRRELEAKLARAIEKHGKPIPDPAKGIGISYTAPAGGDARREGVVPLPALEPAAAVSGGVPMLIVPPPQPAPPPQRNETDLERLDRINAQPANPAPGPLPEWRRWVDENGVRTSPWSGRRY